MPRGKNIKESKALKMPEKEKTFAAAYVVDFNATHAYLAAYPNTKKVNATANGSVFLRRENVQALIKKYCDERINNYKNELEKKIVDVYMKRAFYDASKWFDEKGRLICEWEEFQKSGYGIIVDGIETRAYGKDATNEKTVYKLADKNKALEMLSRYMRIMAENVNVNEKVIIEMGDKNTPL